jgi:hypothetical protein
MYLLRLVYGAGCNDFDAGNIHYKGHWTRLFLAHMALSSLVAISGPKNALIFSAHPFQWPL